MTIAAFIVTVKERESVAPLRAREGGREREPLRVKEGKGGAESLRL